MRVSSGKSLRSRPFDRRTFLSFVAAALPFVSRFARADAYPSRPVRFIVPFAAGGPADVSARFIGQALSERLGQQIIIENRPGAATNLATEAVVRAPPDGYTLLYTTVSAAINPALYDGLSFNFMRDTVPVAGVMRHPGVMEVNLMVPAKTVPEFIAWAKANPGQVNMAASGPGSVPTSSASCSRS